MRILTDNDSRKFAEERKKKYKTQLAQSDGSNFQNAGSTDPDDYVGLDEIDEMRRRLECLEAATYHMEDCEYDWHVNGNNARQPFSNW